MRLLRASFLLAALCVPASLSASEGAELSMMLTIDEAEIGNVANGEDVRRALAKCDPPRTCGYVGLHREPQIDFAAVFEDGGYTIGHRTGPPGPEFDAKRKGTGAPDRFSIAEVIAITANYIDGRETDYVDWIGAPLP